MRRNDVTTEEIIQAYTVSHLTMREIGKLYTMTRQGVYKRLKRAGIGAEDGEWVRTICAFCGKDLQKRRRQWRKYRRSFCNADCYGAALENPNYVQWRHGGRIARALVRSEFDLQPEHIVHHKDGNQRNNEVRNLAVVAGASEHRKLHHGSPVDFLWEGSVL